MMLTGIVETSEPVITVYPGPAQPRPERTATPVGAYPGSEAYPIPPTTSGYPQPSDRYDAAATPADSYPGPVQTSTVPESEGEPTSYPGPGMSIPTPTDPYPGPGDTTNMTTPSPTSSSLAASPSPDTYPAPATTLPALTASVTPTATPSSITPTQSIIGTATATPTITLTPTLVRIEQQVTPPEEFVLISGQVQFIEFFAEWAPLCKSMAPILNGLEDLYGEKINFVFLDIDDPANGLYKILMDGNQLPPIFFLVNGDGEIINSWTGYVDQAVLEFALESVDS